MKFTFQLETVLKVRRILEDHEWYSLQRIIHDLNSTHVKLDQVRAKFHDWREASEKELSKGLAASMLRCERSGEAELQRAGSALESRIVEVELHLDQQRQLLVEARKNREAIDSVRQHRFEEYLRDQSKKEQAQIDELFLLRKVGQRGRSCSPGPAGIAESPARSLSKQ